MPQTIDTAKKIDRKTKEIREEMQHEKQKHGKNKNFGIYGFRMLRFDMFFDNSSSYA